jgi:four helix bundle protein
MKTESRTGLKDRTRAFALQIVRLYSALPKTTVAQVLGKQVLRSGTSVGAHYHEGVRGRSDAEFISKLEGALQELEETRYWLDLMIDANVVAGSEIAGAVQEARELTAILVTCVRKVKERRDRDER